MPVNKEPIGDTKIDITDHEAAALVRTVTNLFARWNLSETQAATILGLGYGESLSEWKMG